MSESRKCERGRCRRDALPGSRWCLGHCYVGEGYVAPDQRDPVQAAIQEQARRTGESLGAVILRRLGLKK